MVNSAHSPEERKATSNRYTARSVSEPSADGRQEASPLIGLKPLKADAFNAALSVDYVHVKDRALSHEVRAARWDVLAAWARLIVALSAAVSSISLLADNTVVTTAFSVLTAVVAGLNAAFNPSDSASQHRRAAKEYQLIRRRLDLLWRQIRPEGPDDGPSHRYSTGPTFQEEDLGSLFEIFLDYRAQIEAADERAPAINRLSRDRPSRHKSVRTWSWWRLQRWKKSLEREAKARRLEKEFEKDCNDVMYASPGSTSPGEDFE